MFKSMFAKHLTAFVAIIMISFIMLSGIITSVIRTRLDADKVNKLEMSTSLLVDYFEENNVELLYNYINSPAGAAAVTMIPLVNVDYDFHILITDTTGEVLLSTFNSGEDKKPAVGGDLGNIDISDFEEIDGTDDEKYLYTSGAFADIAGGEWICYGKPVVTAGESRGYVFTFASSGSDDRLISTTRRTVFNSSLWVMVAAVIATYFITERIAHPLKNMTGAAKKFAKGDFTERVAVYGNDEVSELAIAFNNMAESLESLEKMRNSFLASVSHDLRTPMTTIAGFIEGITSGAIPPEQHGHYLGIISAEVHRLSRLVGQLLDLSRLESGDRKFNFTEFDIAEVARLVIISFEQKLEDKQLEVEFVSDEDYMPVLGDKDAIYQVIYNLCHNAIKFSVEGGAFRINITRSSGKKIRFSVYDDGQTISREDAAHIFDRFYKTDKSRGLDKNGVGLGLYICKTIIDAHGECISVDTLENGCEFSFTLKESDGARHRALPD